MQITAKHFLTSRPAIRHLRITGHPPVLLLSTRAGPPPLHRAVPTRPLMTPAPTFMLPTIKTLPARVVATEPPLAALPLLLHPPTLAAEDVTDTARWAGALVAAHSARVGVAGERMRTGAVAGEVLAGAAAGGGGGAAEAAGGDGLRARGTGPRVAEEEAVVAAGRAEGGAADFVAGVGEDPGVGRGVLELAAEAAVGAGDLGVGVGEAAFGAVPV